MPAGIRANHGKSCPHCGAEVAVSGGVAQCYVCPRCGPVDPVERLAKVFGGGGPLRTMPGEASAT
jgi:hypothetical protein